MLYLASANLNTNKRLENHSIHAGGSLPGGYLEMVRELWELQRPGEAFDGGAKCARHHTDEIFRRRS